MAMALDSNIKLFVSRSKAFIRQAALPIHRHFRSVKSTRLLTLLGPHPGQLLDVGGGTGMNGEFTPLYERFDAVTVANVTPPSILDTDDSYHLRVVNADGRCLPFKDRSFDWVFSNAVIEHVGNWEDQRKFASEIRRVASRGYFITTPNLYFPIEPHALLPLYQFYPERLKPFALRLSPGYMKDAEHIELLSKKQVQVLFPEAQVLYVNLASALIAFHVI